MLPPHLRDTGVTALEYSPVPTRMTGLVEDCPQMYESGTLITY